VNTLERLQVWQRRISPLQHYPFLQVCGSVVAPNVHIFEKDVWVYNLVGIRLMAIEWRLDDVVPGLL
jgi:hypothetical protein